MLTLGVDHVQKGGPGGNSSLTIKQKISQWEGLSLQEDTKGTTASRKLSEDLLAIGLDSGDCGRSKAAVSKTKSPQEDVRNGKVQTQRTIASRKLSGDLLGHRLDSGDCVHGKVAVSKAKSLDFREKEMHFRPITGEVKSDFPGGQIYKLVTPVTNRSSTVRQVHMAKQNVKGNSMKTNHLSNHEIAPLPQFVNDPEASLPPGNFYTSRGFWKQLEADESFWEREKNSSIVTKRLEIGPSFPPPKPQRTFQYKGASSPPDQWIQLENHTSSSGKSKQLRKHDVILKPPSCPPPPCPVNSINGFSRNKQNRKSFEFEDVVRLSALKASRGKEGRRLFHALSEDSLYEDIISDVPKDNPYEDIRLSPMCLPIRRQRNYTVGQRERPHIKLSPNHFTITPNGDRFYNVGRDRKETNITSPTRTSTTNTPRSSTVKPATTAKMIHQPMLVTKIQEVFDAKRGRKRVWVTASRDETSGTESDPEESSKERSRRTVYVQSTLKRRPDYRTLEKDLIQLQQQQLFQQFVVVSLRKRSPGNTYIPEVTQQFPTKDWRPSSDHSSETFSFVLTGEDGSRLFGYCRKILPSGKGKRLPEVHCIISRLGCFNLFSKILEEVERRREISPALVSPFMHSVMEAPFPAPGRTITVKSFLPGSGNEVLTLCRPVDSRLEHVDFESLLQCLSVSRLMQVFASLLLERRVIFIADKLSVLSRCAHAALALLYPFTWQHTFVPVLPAGMLDICCSPTPFVMGALSPSLAEVLEMPIEEVLIVDLCGDKFVVQLQAALEEILENREEILEHSTHYRRGDQSQLSSLVSEAFVWFLVELVGHYSIYLTETGSGGTRELQRDAFLKSHPSRRVRQFLQLFMDTQMFAGFIQDRELRKGSVKGLFELRAAEYLDSYPEPEPSGVNRFLKGLGNKMKFLQKK
ncbi:hypothetical protein DNTS_007888 [Danionella cerebrum]|uniref:UDENN domain-containing protein n=1 Tax=Danionella cerebrum TaxID=2873325 RepID=A0A553PXN2_9TELE|nr:hypothetical protein DNTS_007888 [Danionella translucida]